MGWPPLSRNQESEPAELVNPSIMDEDTGHSYEHLRRSESSAAGMPPKQRLGHSIVGGETISGKIRKHLGLGAPDVDSQNGHSSESGSTFRPLVDAASIPAATAAGKTWRSHASQAHHGHDRPSFRVIGVQISHLTRTGQFLFCTLGVFSFLLVYGFLQEYMVIHVFERRLGIFLTLCQFSGYSSLAALHRLIHADTPRRIPFGYYILLASLQALMQGLTNLSMRWLNYPAKMLFKSSRVIPTMLVGILIMKKRYKVRCDPCMKV